MEEGNKNNVDPQTVKASNGDSKEIESGKRHSIKDWLLEPAVIIASVSALAYLCAYIYEKSYCDYFGIPTDLISISWIRFFSYTPILMVISLPLLLTRILTSLKSAFYALCLTLVLLFVFKFTGAITSWGTFSILITCAALMLFTPILSLYTFKSFRSATPEKRRAVMQLRSETTKYSLILLIVIFAIFFLYSYINGGVREAETRLVYSIQSFTQNPPIANLSVEELYEQNQNAQNLSEQNLVVLRIYGDKAICAPWYVDNQSGNYITKEFVILPLENITLTPQQIGPLHVK